MPSDLSQEQYPLLDGGEWFTNLIIDAAQSTLAQQFPEKVVFQYIFRFQSVGNPVEKQQKGTTSRVGTTG